MSNTYKILICDDHEVVSYGIAEKILNEMRDVDVRTYEEPESAVSALSKFKPSIVISDLHYKDEKSFVLVEACVTRKVPCLIFSSYENKIFIDKAQQLGPVSYVSKLSSFEQLLAGIKHGIQGKVFFCPRIMGVLKDYSEEKELFEPELSEREVEIMQKFAKGKSINEVAQELKITYATVRTHRKRMTHRNRCTFDQLLFAFREWYGVQ
ncbi:response regulator transcription factor [bacterium]|nr:response regulator transcription factor [bacterium]